MRAIRIITVLLVLLSTVANGCSEEEEDLFFHYVFAMITGNYALAGKILNDPCLYGPTTISNPMVRIIASGSNTVTIKSTADIVGVFDPATGRFVGEGIGTIGSDTVRESFDGIFKGKDGDPITLVGVLRFLWLSGAQKDCIQEYQSTYTQIVK